MQYSPKKLLTGLFVAGALAFGIACANSDEPQSVRTSYTATPTRAYTQTPRPTVKPTRTPLPTATPYDFSKEIEIIGDEECVAKTQAALDLLKTEVPQHYQLVEDNLGIVECIEAGSEVFTGENPPRFVVGRVTRNANSIEYASVLRHEAQHVIARKEGRPYMGRDAELEAMMVQRDLVRELNGPQYIIDNLTYYIENIDTEQFWLIPDDEREY